LARTVSKCAMRNLFSVMVCVIPFFAYAAEPITILEDFQAFKAGDVPTKGWRTRDGSPKGLYSIEEESDNRFLRAKYTNKSIQIFREKGWKISAQPTLSWSWRVHEFPAGSDERVGEKNDSAAGVYVVFPGRFFVPRVIKYIWSHQVPVGTVIKRDDRFPMIVVRSGESSKGEWVSEKRNVLEDFKKLFGMAIQDPKAFGFLTDGNSVKAKPMADYDNITVSDEGKSK